MPPTEKPTDQSKRDGSMWFVEQGPTLEASSVISGIFLRAFFAYAPDMNMIHSSIRGLAQLLPGVAGYR